MHSARIYTNTLSKQYKFEVCAPFLVLSAYVHCAFGMNKGKIMRLLAMGKQKI